MNSGKSILNASHAFSVPNPVCQTLWRPEAGGAHTQLEQVGSETGTPGQWSRGSKKRLRSPRAHAERAYRTENQRFLPLIPPPAQEGFPTLRISPRSKTAGPGLRGHQEPGEPAAHLAHVTAPAPSPLHH